MACLKFKKIRTRGTVLLKLNNHFTWCSFVPKTKNWVGDKDIYPGMYIGVGEVEGTPLYGLYRYVRPQRVGFSNRFGHK